MYVYDNIMLNSF